MYLLLLRWIDGQYGEVFQLADFCVTDTALKKDEAQIFRQLMVKSKTLGTLAVYSADVALLLLTR